MLKEVLVQIHYISLSPHMTGSLGDQCGIKIQDQVLLVCRGVSSQPKSRPLRLLPWILCRKSRLRHITRGRAGTLVVLRWILLEVILRLLIRLPSVYLFIIFIYLAAGIEPSSLMSKLLAHCATEFINIQQMIPETRQV